jgi:Zn-dependent membrane protease YugP
MSRYQFPQARRILDMNGFHPRNVRTAQFVIRDQFGPDATVFFLHRQDFPAQGFIDRLGIAVGSRRTNV